MICIVLGTKAQLIKMAPVMVRLAERSVPYRFIATGQHASTMAEIVDQFGIRSPDVTLYSGGEIDSLGRVPGWTIQILIKTLVSRTKLFGPRLRGIVLVHGDTFSTLLGAWMGRLAGLRVGHVESGLRSFHWLHPFPEELTRLATMRLSHILFCPGAWAANNVAGLKREVVDTHVNTLADSVALALSRSHGPNQPPKQPFGLVSLHRFENIFMPAMLAYLMALIEDIAARHRLVFILHPPTEKRLRASGWLDRLGRNGRIELRARCPYFEFVSLVQAADFVITDGGSIQEESSYLGVPCLLLRKATERPEGIGRNVVLSEYLSGKIMDFVDNHRRYRTQPMLPSQSASDIIVDSVVQYA